MKVILLRAVAGLGEAGSVVEVADGYARNFLLPRGLAEKATEEGVRRLAATRARHEAAARRQLERAKEAAAAIDGRSVLVRARAGENGRLFGSVTTQDIAAAIAEQCGVSVDRRRIELEEPLRTLGVHPVAVRLHPEVRAQLQVEIVAG
ncbi:MAG: 50S ribosomal protein L9 [Clostridia bacterium]|nr:50S ribosomal protein L9 [Clostridia bacterium]